MLLLATIASNAESPTQPVKVLDDIPVNEATPLSPVASLYMRKNRRVPPPSFCESPYASRYNVVLIVAFTVKVVPEYDEAVSALEVIPLACE